MQGRRRSQLDQIGIIISGLVTGNLLGQALAKYTGSGEWSVYFVGIFLGAGSLFFYNGVMSLVDMKATLERLARAKEKQ